MQTTHFLRLIQNGFCPKILVTLYVYNSLESEPYYHFGNVFCWGYRLDAFDREAPSSVCHDFFGDLFGQHIYCTLAKSLCSEMPLIK